MTTTDTAPPEHATSTAPDDGRIRCRQLASELADDAPLVLDVRSRAEFAAAHVPGSHNLPLPVVEHHSRRVAAEASRPVVVVCASGNRSDRAATALRAAGLADVRSLVGGTTAWQEQGGDVAGSGSSTWDMGRQVRFTAGSLILLASAASLVVPRARWLATGVGAGLAYSGASGSCAMADVLGRMPWNQVPDPASDDELVDAALA